MLMLEGRIHEAAPRLEKALELAPHDVEIILALARVRIEQRRSVEAAALLDRALELEPDHRAAADLRAGVSASR